MAVTKEITCPHCKKAAPWGDEFKHDAQLNFICSHCGKVIFGVTEEAEAELKRCFAGDSSTGTVYGGTWAAGRKEPLPIQVPGMSEPEDTPPVAGKTEKTGSCSAEPDIDEYSCYV